MARRAIYGSNLDALQQAGTAEEDQDLRDRTAGQGFLAQLAGERTRRRGTEADYDVGLRSQETGRLASERGLEAAIASANAQRAIADTYAESQKYQADKFYDLDKMKLDWQKELARTPKGLSEEMQTLLMQEAVAEKAAAAAGVKTAAAAKLAATPTYGEGLRALALRTINNYAPGGRLIGAGINAITPDWMITKAGMPKRSRAAIERMRGEGVDTSRLTVNPTTGEIEAAPADESFAQWLSRGNPNVFGRPDSFAPYKGDVYVPKEGDTMPVTAGPSTAGSKKRISYSDLIGGVRTGAKAVPVVGALVP